MQVSVYERTKQSRYQNRRTGENRTQKRPAHREADRGRGRADFDQKSPSSPRHQGDAGGRAGRPGAGNKMNVKVQAVVIGEHTKCMARGGGAYDLCYRRYARRI